jgi:2-haloacid dehalogenase
VKTSSILFFDIGGTVFDWETSIVEALMAGDLVDEPHRRNFAWECREAFLADSSAVRKGLLPWKEADELFADVVDGQLQRRNIEGGSAEVERVRRAWSNMPAWPEAIEAIAALRKSYRVVPLSLLSWSMAIGSSRRNGISWDGLLTCDVMGFYKPDPRCFTKALGLFKARPEEVIMVASHPSDLYAARDYGFETAYVRPRLPDPGEDYASCRPEKDFDYCFEGFPALAAGLIGRSSGAV